MTKMHTQDDWRIRINGGESHPLPHVHVEFRDGSRFSVAIASLEVLTGAVRPWLGLPRTRMNWLMNIGG